jgi:hypothetical protein
MKRFPLMVCSTFAVALLLSALGGSAVAQGASLIGHWTLNPAKSKFSSESAPKSGSLTIEILGRAATTTVDTVLASGEAQHWTYTGAYDGVDVPVTGANQYGDMASRKRINATTTETTFKKDGKVTFVNRIVVSADNKLLTVTSKGTDAQGGAVSNVQVFDRAVPSPK